MAASTAHPLRSGSSHLSPSPSDASELRTAPIHRFDGRAPPERLGASRFALLHRSSIAGVWPHGGGGSPGSDRLDESTTRYVKGDGILASIKDVSVAPTEFAEGCKLLQACALGDRTRVEALLRINKGHINFRD